MQEKCLEQFIKILEVLWGSLVELLSSDWKDVCKGLERLMCDVTPLHVQRQWRSDYSTPINDRTLGIAKNRSII